MAPIFRLRGALALLVVFAVIATASAQDSVRPPVLDRPLESQPAAAAPAAPAAPDTLLQTKVDPPLGFTGPSGIVPRATQESSHFVPMEDRWRLGFPQWDRYDKGHPQIDDYPYVPGRWYDPYNQNVLKGDYPIIGQHTFLELTLSTLMLNEVRQTPIPNTPFESTTRPDRFDFFGSPNQYAYSQYFTFSIDLIHGDAGFKPADWRVHITPVFNVNYLAVDELAVVNPDVRRGTDRGRTWFALQEYFVESKIMDLSPDYDFLSVRAGSQFFSSDFRGFIFSDTNRAVRLFGTRLANKEQFNLLAFDQQEKDTNSELNTFSSRHQNIFIANYYRQDFLFPGYTTELSVHYNHDRPSFRFDKNDFLVRPDPVGVFQPHKLDVAYLGWAGDGHIERYNITHAMYWALGRDSLNPIANQKQDISAYMAAVELSYDRDWIRFRTSFFYSSGDDNVSNSHATGFDSIMDHPNFAGGDFSFWDRQAIKLFGVNLTNRQSLIPDLRSSKIQGQSNFVNPGLFLFNVGADLEVTPRFRLINNLNFLWFDETQPLEIYVFQDGIRDYIGADLSVGFEYRPLLSNNIIITGGVSTLIPGAGFKDLYNQLRDNIDPLVAAFVTMELTF